MRASVQNKQFRSTLEKIHERLRVCQKLTFATQLDWQAIFRKKNGELLLEIVCEEEIKRFSSLDCRRFSLSFNGKEVDELTIDFFSAGNIQPQGVLTFKHPCGSSSLQFPEFFQMECLSR